MATYYIGDIHGCYKSLMTLLDTINYNNQKDNLIFMGDLISRGPDSIKVLKWVMNDKSSISIQGNHELTLIAYSLGVLDRIFPDFDKILEHKDAKKILKWLYECPIFIKTKDGVVTHAGIPPGWSTKDAKKNASFVETIIKDKNLAPNFLKYAYSKDITKKINNSDSDKDIFTYTVNALLRMRYTTEEGELDFKQKTDPKINSSFKKDGKTFKPWFMWRDRKKEKHRLIFGHWGALGLYKKDPYYCIDSGCFWGNGLTAICFSEEVLKTFSVKIKNGC